MNKFLVVAVVLALLAGIVGVVFIRYAKTNDIPLGAFLLAQVMDAERYTLEGTSQQMPYRLYKPKAEPDENLPLVLVLQTGYGRGDNNLSQLDATVLKIVSASRSDKSLKAFVLAPQCPKRLEWNDSPPSSPPFVNIDMQSLPTSWRLQALVGLVESLTLQHAIDPQRIYVVGASMGATGLWSLLYRYPQVFSAALVMNGRSDPSVAQYVETPVWVFHGREDSVAPAENSIAMTKALEQQEKPYRLTLIDGAGHGISDAAIDESSLAWLFSHRGDPPSFALNPAVTH